MIEKKDAFLNDKLMLTEEILNDPRVFKIWFINAYMNQFNEYPLLDNYEIKSLIKMKNYSIDEYMQVISHYTSMSLYGQDISKRILDGTRKQEVCLISKITCYILVKRMSFSKMGVARVMLKNHATVIHHCRTVEGFLNFDKEFVKKFEEILKVLRSRGIIIS